MFIKEKLCQGLHNHLKAKIKINQKLSNLHRNTTNRFKLWLRNTMLTCWDFYSNNKKLRMWDSKSYWSQQDRKKGDYKNNVDYSGQKHRLAFKNFQSNYLIISAHKKTNWVNLNGWTIFDAEKNKLIGWTEFYLKFRRILHYYL